MHTVEIGCEYHYKQTHKQSKRSLNSATPSISYLLFQPSWPQGSRLHSQRIFGRLDSVTLFSGEAVLTETVMVVPPNIIIGLTNILIRVAFDVCMYL